MLGAFIVEIFIAPAIIQVAATLFGSYNMIQFTGAYACFLLYALIWFISSLLIRCDAPWNLYINCMYLVCGNPMLGPLSYEYWPGGVLLLSLNAF